MVAHRQGAGSVMARGERRSKEVGLVQAANNFIALAQQLARQEDIGDLEAKLAGISDHLQPEHIEDFATLVKLLSRERQTESKKATTFKVTMPTSKEWKKPTTADRKKGKKIWSVSWQGFKLRVEFRKDPALKVVFDKFIDDEAIGHEKTLAVAQNELVSEALNRLKNKA